MFKSSVSVSPYSIAQFLNFVLRNKKQKVLSHWYMRWRWIGGHVFARFLQVFLFHTKTIWIIVTDLSRTFGKALKQHMEKIFHWSLNIITPIGLMPYQLLESSKTTAGIIVKLHVHFWKKICRQSTRYTHFKIILLGMHIDTLNIGCYILNWCLPNNFNVSY